VSDAHQDSGVGAQVVVTAPDDRVIGVGVLSSGRLQTGTNEAILTCEFTFAVNDVPDSERFYGVQVGGRQKHQFTRDRARKPLLVTVH
jgi:hypothetical protein